jgi:hypothetical protein
MEHPPRTSLRRRSSFVRALWSMVATDVLIIAALAGGKPTVSTVAI